MTAILIQITRAPGVTTKPRRVTPDGAVVCQRKGPIGDFIAWERCLEMRELNSAACGACRQYTASTVGAAFARSEESRQRWSKQ